MVAREARNRLNAIVEEADLVSRDDVTPRAALDAFEAFAVIAVEDADEREDGDLLLFETAIAPSGEFEASLSRQLFLEEGGLNTGMIDVSLGIRVTPEAETTELIGTQIWGVGGPPWGDAGFRAAAEFIEEVARAPAFQAIAGRPCRVFVGG